MKAEYGIIAVSLYTVSFFSTRVQPWIRGLVEKSIRNFPVAPFCAIPDDATSQLDWKRKARFAGAP